MTGTVQEFDFNINLTQVLLWQRQAAVRLQSLVNAKQAWFDTNQTDFWESWYDNVFNLATANDFGLSVWSIILNLPLFIGAQPDPPGKRNWGFGAFRKNFNNGNFSSGSSGGISLTTQEKRLLLQLRYFQLTSRCAIPGINAFLKIVFADLGPVYVLDGFDMTIHVIIRFAIDPRLLYILKTYNLIPRGAGVGIEYRVVRKNTFGFGPFNKNFNNGNFGS